MHGPPRLLALDEARAGQHVEVLHHRRQRHRERCGDLADGQLRLTRQTVDNGAPRRIGKRREGQIEPGIAIVNHVVKYWHRCAALSRGDEEGGGSNFSSPPVIAAAASASRGLAQTQHLPLDPG